MALNSFAKNKKWYTKVWLVEKLDPKHFAYVPTTTSIAREDNNYKVLKHTLVLQELVADIDAIESNPIDASLIADLDANEVDDVLDPMVL